MSTDEDLLAALDAMGQGSADDTTDTDEQDSTPVNDPAETLRTESDAVAQMQQLLLAHEEAHIHEVEDPKLIRVLDELESIAHSNVVDLWETRQIDVMHSVSDEGEPTFQQATVLSLKDVTCLPRHVTASIKKIKVTSKPGGDVVEVEMYDKASALDKLMKYHGAYERDNAQQAKGVSAAMDLMLASIGSAGLPTLTNNDA